MIKGVITGDLVNSSKIAPKWRKTLVDVLKACAEDFEPNAFVKIEMYRGDSFQAIVSKPEKTLAVAIALRAKLRGATPKGCDIWDARISIGLGEISFESDNILTSDGEAFRLSGRAFDSIGKRRLCISTPWADFNESINLVTRFADDVISAWTARQAQVVYHSILFPKMQKDMAEELGMTRQNFNYHWITSKCQLILSYIEYYQSLVLKNNP